MGKRGNRQSGVRKDERQVERREERARQRESAEPDWTDTDWDSFVVEPPAPDAAAAAAKVPKLRASAGDQASIIKGAFRDYDGKVRVSPVQTLIGHEALLSAFSCDPCTTLS